MENDVFVSMCDSINILINDVVNVADLCGLSRNQLLRIVVSQLFAVELVEKDEA